MSLRTVADSDLLAIVEDTDLLATDITCTDEHLVTATVRGQANQTALGIDPDTGQHVAGKQASAVILRSAIVAAGLSEPKAVAELTSTPWRVSWVGPADAVTRTFKVVEVLPDETRGLLTLKLEVYRDP